MSKRKFLFVACLLAGSWIQAGASTATEVEAACRAALKPFASTWVSDQPVETAVFSGSDMDTCKVSVDVAGKGQPRMAIYLINVRSRDLSVVSIDELLDGRARRLAGAAAR